MLTLRLLMPGVALCAALLSAVQGETIVVDNGSGFVRVGLSSDAEPASVNNIIGRPRRYMTGIESTYFDEDAMTNRIGLRITRPTQWEFIDNLEDQKLVWQYALQSKLGTSMAGKTVLMSIPSRVGGGYKSTLENAVMSMGAVSVTLVPDAVLALNSIGLKTGVVLQAGYAVTTAVAVIDGEVQPDTYRQSTCAGSVVTTELSRLIRDNFEATYRQYIVDAAKIDTCYVALDYEKEMEKSPSSIRKDFPLTDGSVIPLEQERFQAPEIMFHEYENLSDGIPQMVYEAVQSSPSGVRESLWSNVMIAGGSTQFPGFKERLQKELSQLSGYSVNILAPADRIDSVWKGGALMAREM